MYFRDSQILFLHPTKTAGSTIEHYLMQSIEDSLVPPRLGDFQHLNTDSYDEGHEFKKQVLFGNYRDAAFAFSLQHAAIRDVRRFLGDEAFDNAYKIATVRNPYTRAVSIYYYYGYARRMTFADYVDRELPTLMRQSARATNQTAPQTAYTHENGERIVDLILRQERLRPGLMRLSKVLGIPIQYNRQTRLRPSEARIHLKSHFDVYDAQTRSIVRDLYRDDFELLGYSAD